MPSEKVLSEKKAAVELLVSKMKDAKAIVLVDYKGISVSQDTKLRAELRREGVEYAVVKNTLLQRACKEAGFEDFIPQLSGTTSLALSDDEVAPARVILKYAVKGKDIFKFKTGFVGGKYVNAEELKAIATLPSRDGLIAQVAGTFNNIIASLARAIDEVAKKQSAA